MVQMQLLVIFTGLIAAVGVPPLQVEGRDGQRVLTQITMGFNKDAA